VPDREGGLHLVASSQKVALAEEGKDERGEYDGSGMSVNGRRLSHFRTMIVLDFLTSVLERRGKALSCDWAASRVFACRLSILALEHEAGPVVRRPVPALPPHLHLRPAQSRRRLFLTQPCSRFRSIVWSGFTTIADRYPVYQIAPPA